MVVFPWRTHYSGSIRSCVLQRQKSPHLKSSFVLYSLTQLGVQSRVMHEIIHTADNASWLSNRSNTVELGVPRSADQQKTHGPPSIALPGERQRRTEKLLTPDEVVILMHVKMSWLMDHVTRIEPIIPHIRMGKIVRFKRSSLAKWIDSLVSTKPKWA
jgi:hypothetical protein